MTTTTERFNRPDYGVSDQADKARRTIGVFAPKGATISCVLHILPNGYRRLRLYTTWRGKITRIDQLVSAPLFEELIAILPYDADRVSYNSFDHTDGTDHSGFGWPAGSYSNVGLGIVYTLAEVIHGDRKTWNAEWL